MVEIVHLHNGSVSIVKKVCVIGKAVILKNVDFVDKDDFSIPVYNFRSRRVAYIFRGNPRDIDT